MKQQPDIPGKCPQTLWLTPQAAARRLQEGGVVAVPTETVYGLAADVYNPLAIERIFTIKERPANDPLIVHIHEESQLTSLVNNWPEVAIRLAEVFWPGPLTMIAPKHAKVPDIVTAGLPSVAIRMPAHPVMREILQCCQTPLAAPSANRFGCISPTTAKHVGDSLGNKPDGIVDGGPCTIGLESTIIAFAKKKIFLLRPGAITAQEIRQVSGFPVSPYKSKDAEDVPAPGTMPRHYAPQTPIAVLGTAASSVLLNQKKLGRIAFGKDKEPHTVKYHQTMNLSPNADLSEAATRLYDAMRYMDTCHLDAILIDPIPTDGIGSAINDRIRRATQNN